MNDRVPVKVTTAPEAIGPYSQAIKVGNFVYTSGCIPLDLKTGQLVSEDIAVQTRTVLQYLREILEAVEIGGFMRTVKTTIFLTDLNDFATVNKIYGEFFTHDQPARSTVQVAALPRGSKIEIEAVAIFPFASMATAPKSSGLSSF